MIADRPCIDHHCHGVVPRELDRRAFEALMSEAHRPHLPGCSQFDKALGLSMRRFCAPVLDLEPLASPEAYIARRQELGAAEVNRRLLRAARLSRLLIDSGHRSDSLLDVEAMAEAAATPTREVVRIEAVMEEAARQAGSAGELLDRFRESLLARSAEAVGLKSIVAYRVTFDIDQTRPAHQEVADAAGAWLARNERQGWGRLEDAPLIRHGLFLALDVCVERGFPLQLHVGVGDQDVHMSACDPTVFTPFIATAEERDVPITLLHCFPFVREAGWLAEVFSNVYFDVGFTLNFTGPQAKRALKDGLEMGPFFKQLYSSDAFGLAELYYLGRVQFARSLKAILDGWIGEGDCTAADAERIAAMISHENAERIYGV